VALADKLDTLVGFFAIDEKPTGSKDPFALRRAALGVIRLVLENGVRLPLYDTIEQTNLVRRFQADPNLKISPTYFDVFGQGLEPSEFLKRRPERLAAATDPAAITDIDKPLWNALGEFSIERLKVFLRDRGLRPDLIDASYASSDDDLVRIVRRVEALDAFLATDDGANLLAGYKRASNILKAEAKKGDIPTGMVQTGLPNQPEAETTLAFAADAARTAVDTALDTEDFAAAMTALARLRAPVDAFFTDVMVNSDVPEERDNRLKLLGQVRDVMGRVADFGQISG
ncbi:glycine--tRNA ligase subunit beta, partial [Brevundimonas sp.]|uniref:glycine--tRNA ligase subunit beta n=1 Tax=Brevundimonas sp. TaxID=1871086 RepID=UPI001A186FED